MSTRRSCLVRSRMHDDNDNICSSRTEHPFLFWRTLFAIRPSCAVCTQIAMAYLTVAESPSSRPWAAWCRRRRRRARIRRRQFIDFRVLAARWRPHRRRRESNQGHAEHPPEAPAYLTRSLLYLDGHCRVNRRRTQTSSRTISHTHTHTNTPLFE